MERGLLKRTAKGPCIDGGEALFIAQPLFTFLLIVGENVAGSTEATRLGRSSCNCPDARFFSTQVAAVRASLHARLLARPFLTHASKGRRAHALDARIGGSSACIFARTQKDRPAYVID